MVVWKIFFCKFEGAKKIFHNRLNNHLNKLIKKLATPTIPGNPPRRLKRKWCRDLLN